MLALDDTAAVTILYLLHSLLICSLLLIPACYPKLLSIGWVEPYQRPTCPDCPAGFSEDPFETGSKIRPGHRTSLSPKLLDPTGLLSRAEGDSSLARLMLTLRVSYSVVVSEGDFLLHHPRYRRRLATSQVCASRVNPLPLPLMITSGGTPFEGDPSGFPLGVRHTVTLVTMT